MKYRLYIIHFLLLTLILQLNNELFAQAVGVTITRSTEKALINGKVYFIHTVKKGETLYSIAKAYQVSIEEVIANNPSLTNDLQLNQLIRIPEISNKVTPAPALKPSNGEVLHVVSAGQTIYSISRIYGIEVAELEATNPEVRYDSLQINQVLKIPVEKKQTPTEINSDNYLVHKVIENETFYSLCKQFGISQEELVKLNTPLLNDGLKVGFEIRIPNSAKTSTPEPTRATAKTAVIAVADTNCALSSRHFAKDTITVSLMLPLFSSGGANVAGTENEEDSNEENIQQRPSEEFNPLAINFIEFYQGFMLAASDLKKNGLTINLQVYDTEKDNKRIGSIVGNANFQKSNLVIGPVYPEQMKHATSLPHDKKMIFVSPVAQNEEMLNTNSPYFQVNPGIQLEYKKCIDLLTADTTQNILIVYQADATSTVDKNELFKKLLQEQLNGRNVKIKSLNIFGNDFTGIENELDSMRNNIVYSPVNDEIFVTNFLGQLVAKLIKYKIKAIGMHEWTSYRGIDLNYFYDLQMTYNTPFYADFNSDKTIAFIKKYRLVYGTEPIRNSKYGFNYGILGYDLAHYFILSYAYFGNEMPQNSACSKQLKLISPFHFSNDSISASFINKYVRTITYTKDYSLEVVDCK